MQINKAILHIFDSISDIIVLADKGMDMQDNTINLYLEKHIQKSILDPNLKFGSFQGDSPFLSNLRKVIQGNLSFECFSRQIAKDFFSMIKVSDQIESTDLLFCQYENDSKNYLGIINFGNKNGYIHQVNNKDAQIQNNIIHNFAILPTTTQKVKECVFINLENLEIKYCDKLRYINGHDVNVWPEKLLQCNTSLSPKESLNIVKNITKNIAEQNGYNPTSVLSHVKEYIVANTETSNKIDTADLGQEIFPDSESVQAKFVEKTNEAGIKGTIAISPAVTRAEKSQKIKTDTGIEITFPVNYFHNKDYIEFINNPDGTISIQIKNIGKIINR
jgi:nucleoid-associated protein YejK